MLFDLKEVHYLLKGILLYLLVELDNKIKLLKFL